MDRSSRIPLFLTLLAVIILIYSYSPIAAPWGMHLPTIFGFPHTIIHWSITSFLLAVLGIILALWTLRREEDSNDR